MRAGNAQRVVDVAPVGQRVAGRFGSDPEVLTPILYRIHVELFECFSGEGTAINSGPFDGLKTAKLAHDIVGWLERRH